MRSLKLLVILFFTSLLGCEESSIDSALEKYNRGTVQYIYAEELTINSRYLILDSREKEEYDVSHIPGAFWVGHKSFTMGIMKTAFPQTDTSLVVYCSIGVRSEDIGEKLLGMGYTDVRNLYGGIFRWKNKGFVVVDSTGNETQNVHAYSKYWGNLLTEANKVY